MRATNTRQQEQQQQQQVLAEKTVNIAARYVGDKATFVVSDCNK